MNASNPLDTLIEQSRKARDHAGRNLADDRRGQAQSAAQLDALRRYRHEYCRRLQDAMSRGIVAATLVGTATWLVLAWEASTDRRALIVDFYDVESPWYRAVAPWFPDHQRLNVEDSILTFVWIAILGASAVIAWRGARPMATEQPVTEDDQPSSMTVS